MFSRVVTSCAALAVSGLALLLPPVVSPAAASEAWPARLATTYAISFNGFDLGTFRLTAGVKGDTYRLDGDAEISALLGTFKWRGITKAEGRIEAARPRPADYIFAFDGTSRSGSIKLGFDGKGPASVSIVPPLPDASDTAPLKPQHLPGALDPLSAVMAMVRPQNGAPCNQRLGVFDGKQRFDLVLTDKGRETVSRLDGRGTEQVFVCAVRYIPIGGYPLNDETRRMANATDIEVAMRPVPAAGLHLPHEIRIPTVAGTVRLTARSLDVAAGTPRLALAR
ncbi:MAG: DUF3108 domain-containing protein [Hyphomicrobiaceae bacterium]|nr:DUF3108 domain-containing protein [Hyphomicrobiaceae bacterium]